MALNDDFRFGRFVGIAIAICFWLFLLISLRKKLIKWLLDAAMQAAGANQSTVARMPALAAQIVGEHAELLQWSQAK
jgi:hypothetical protein